jgi:hypothetical protein
MELLLKIIGSEESPEGSGIIQVIMQFIIVLEMLIHVQWLCGTELVPSLLSKFDPSLDDDVSSALRSVGVDCGRC